ADPASTATGTIATTAHLSSRWPTVLEIVGHQKPSPDAAAHSSGTPTTTPIASQTTYPADSLAVTSPKRAVKYARTRRGSSRQRNRKNRPTTLAGRCQNAGSPTADAPAGMCETLRRLAPKV